MAAKALRRIGVCVFLSVLSTINPALSQDYSVYSHLKRSRDALLEQRWHLQQSADQLNRQIDSLNRELIKVDAELMDTVAALRDLEVSMSRIQ